MDPHVSAWLSLVLRWIHLITGAAWIGTSFYFNWLNNNLRPTDEPRAGVGGELWSVHGGGFYRVEKFNVAPERLPKTLHWFMWEAYFTWITGFSLLALIYYMGADVYLVDPSVAGIGPGTAVAIGLGTLLGSWLVYDLLCKSPLTRTPVLFSTLTFAFAVGLAWGLTSVFSSRGAYIHVGATLGTLMAANVFRVIIPSQREMVDAMSAGREPDAAQGKQAALRSLHNNYMTLPVLFIMVSSHYPMTYGHNANWIVLAALALIGAGTRHWFNLRGKGRRNQWILPVAAAGMIALALGTAPASAPTDSSPTGPHVSFAVVQAIVAEKCAVCHAANPTNTTFGPVAPLGFMLDTPERIRSQADKINAAAVESTTMPIGNITGLTPEERAVLGRWIREGARQ